MKNEPRTDTDIHGQKETAIVFVGKGDIQEFPHHMNYRAFQKRYGVARGFEPDAVL